MIEIAENGLQTAVLLICAGWALLRVLAFESRTWTMLLLFYAGWILGDIYWLVYLLFFGRTPVFSVVSDLSWYAAIMFLYLLLRHTSPPHRPRERRLLPFLGPVFTLGMAAFFMQWGEYGNNLIYACLMGLLLFTALRILSETPAGGKRSLAAVTLVYCLLEYALWTASCFADNPPMNLIYYGLDVLLTGCMVFFLPAVKRTVTA